MPLLKSWREFRRRSGLAREASTLALALVVGLVVLPIGIYIVGRVLFGAYTRSATDPAGHGVFALWTDFLQGLGQGSLAHWLIAVGPYVLWKVLSIGNRALRA